MTRPEKKDQIKKIKKIILSSPNRRVGIKFTCIELNGPFLQISHTAGKEGNTKEEFEDRLKTMGIPSSDDLKEMFEIVEEKGAFHNHYFLELRLKSIDRNRIKQIRGQRIGNIPNAIKL